MTFRAHRSALVAMLVLAALVVLGVAAVAHPSGARAEGLQPSKSQELPTMHYLHGDPQNIFDYVHGAVDVAIGYELDPAQKAVWITGLVAATDWTDGHFVEAGWIRYAPGTFYGDNLHPDCVEYACAYSSRQHGAETTFEDTVKSKATARLTAGMRPWFRVSVESVRPGERLWRTYFSRNGPWISFDGGSWYTNNHFAWITSGSETMSFLGPDSPGAHITDPGIRSQENMYSVVGRGEDWTYGDNCGSQLQHWCYTHILTTKSCAGCGLLKPAGQQNPPWTTACVEIADCTTSWATKTN